MKNKNILLLIGLLVVSALVFILPLFIAEDEISPNTQLANMVSSERYIMSDELATLIINEDPSYVLIDVRNETDYNNYHLPTAINIPFEQLMDETHQAILNQEQQTIILYSNDHLIADNAWFLTKHKGYQRIIVLKDGLNGFYNTILNPMIPSDFASKKEHNLYALRKASGIYFGIPFDNAPEKTVIKAVEQPNVKKVEPIKKVKVEVEEGGC